VAGIPGQRIEARSRVIGQDERWGEGYHALIEARGRGDALHAQLRLSDR
jgi:hypothetical protein